MIPPRVALVGDSHGVPMLLEHVHPSRVACIVAAHTRPSCIALLSRIAADLQVPLLVQPRFGSDEYAQFVESFHSVAAGYVLCYSYAMIVRREILDVVAGRAANFHAALLPRNRGPNPIQWAIIHNERTTGVTMHYMNESIDSGDVIASRSCVIEDHDTWVTLRDRLVVEARALMAEQIPLFLEGSCSRQRQDEVLATTNARLTPDSPRIDFAKMDDRAVFNLIRAQVRPLAGAYLQLGVRRQYFPDYLAMDDVRMLRARYANFSDASASP